MSKRSRLPQTPRHVLIFDEDWDFVETRFGPAGVKPVGVSNVIRAIIHRWVLERREAENRAAAIAAARKHETSMKEPTNADTTDIERPEGGPPGISL